MKKYLLIIFMCIFATLSCKTQTQEDMKDLDKLLESTPIFENQTKLTDKTYFVSFNQLFYADDKPFRNIGDMKITFLENKIIFHQINFLFVTPFDLKLNNALEAQLKKEAIEEIITYFRKYNIEIGSPIIVNIAIE